MFAQSLTVTLICDARGCSNTETQRAESLTELVDQFCMLGWQLKGSPGPGDVGDLCPVCRDTVTSFAHRR